MKRCFVLLIGFGLGGAVFGPLAVLAQSGPPPVDVAPPLVEKIVDWDEFTGRFEAVKRVDVRPRVSGFLQEIKFSDGQIVKRGDLLFVIDARPFKTELDRARAELDAAKAEQTRALTQLTRGQELVSRQALAQSELDERLANRLRADAQVAIAEAAIREAELNVEFTEVRAPFDGRISDRKVDVGALLTQNDTRLATVLARDPIHLTFTGSEADFLKYSRLSASGSRESSRTAANPVEARLIDEQGWPHKGTMNFVDNELDPNSGTIRARAVFPNGNDLLAPGLFARLRLIGSGEYEALLLPDEAILSDQARKIVLIADEAGNVTQKTVKTGPLYKGKRVIRSGLEATDMVIVAGVQRARPGGKVTPQKVELTLDASPSPAPVK
ncbi:MAG: efflux RND transporter periplasmic adaptor subunit [Rhizobiales bacterium]|nr:efflux RND transporter periplasmic adaptor subunit [Hyphomicrobiales bacterium]